MALSSGTRPGPQESLGRSAPVACENSTGCGTPLDGTVAIKVLPEHLAEDPERKHRFEGEARAISHLNHPHICSLYDVGEQDGVGYLVMEHFEGVRSPSG